MSSILLIDDEETITLTLRTLFEKKGYSFINAYSGREGLDTAIRELPDVVLLDLKLPDIPGMTILKELKATHPEVAVVVITGYGEVKEAVEAMKLGAEHYFQKPVDLDELTLVVERSVGIKQLRQEALMYRKSPYPIIGRSRQIQGLIHIINLMAENPTTTVLIEGETGSGKELVARNIHILSRRAERPFVDINCSSLPEQIFESELFGHEAGAYTDARTAKQGLVELADGGTLFLDEVAEMPFPLQAKLLRFLETKTSRRVGGTRDIKVDARVIAATNKNLSEHVRNCTFRDDLYYRLNVIPIEMPPLRERTEDIPLLAEFFVAEMSKNLNRKIQSLDGDALDVLRAYHWPGNIRELRNVLERAAILCQGQTITSQNLTLTANASSTDAVLLKLKDIEKLHILKVLKAVGNNRTKTAQILGISRSTLTEKIKAYQIE